VYMCYVGSGEKGKPRDKKIIIISNQGLQEVDVPFEKDHHMFICRVEGICIWITR
jgi:hypothetical protein